MAYTTTDSLEPQLTDPSDMCCAHPVLPYFSQGVIHVSRVLRQLGVQE